MKRVLIITYYWPPAGGPGVQRWLYFAKYLKDFGVEPVVYVPENPTYPIVDDAMTDKTPDVEVVKRPIREPYKMAKFLSKKRTQQISRGIISEKDPSSLEKMMLFVRGNYFIPDARVGWVKPSVVFLRNFLTERSFDVIITTGPPHSMHLIGLELKKILDIPWVADFRDPWTTIHYHKSMRLTKASEAKHKKLEADVLNSADHIVVTSKTTKKEFSEITKKPISVITNGYEITESITSELDNEFTLAHIGSLLSDRNPETLWKVLKEVTEEDTDFRKELRISLTGVVGEEVLQSIREHGLEQNLIVNGYVSHAEAKRLQHSAQVLLLLEMDKEETRAIIPGKLFEYLAAGRPILSIGPEGSDISDILSETESGAFFTPSEASDLKEQILRYYSEYKSGAFHTQPKNINKYSRRELTRVLSDLIKSL
ncbi:glycosyltransferase family 4 protein [Aureitalea sp. L0-47]|uniref:glycosyltransferase family 4 protein n=1 Tax=Aureitalea sp. L0-47 TaxID=2816962 RepID=UPI0022373302|nr:glycosyltransferase family 4 protein [Aureitalea sp. L0-47]MCW5520512.1 glycosyltransferase family 4 protein [Aureitalea sp. L0-47]